MTKEIQISNHRLLIVEVLEGSGNFQIGGGELTYQTRKDLFIHELPLGKWQILGKGLASEIIREEWMQIIESTIGFELEINDRNYLDDSRPFENDPISSGLSLLCSHGFNDPQGRAIC